MGRDGDEILQNMKVCFPFSESIFGFEFIGNELRKQLKNREVIVAQAGWIGIQRAERAENLPVLTVKWNSDVTLDTQNV